MSHQLVVPLFFGLFVGPKAKVRRWKEHQHTSMFIRYWDECWNTLVDIMYLYMYIYTVIHIDMIYDISHKSQASFLMYSNSCHRPARNSSRVWFHASKQHWQYVVEICWIVRTPYYSLFYTIQVIQNWMIVDIKASVHYHKAVRTTTTTTTTTTAAATTTTTRTIGALERLRRAEHGWCLSR